MRSRVRAIRPRSNFADDGTGRPLHEILQPLGPAARLRVAACAFDARCFPRPRGRSARARRRARVPVRLRDVGERPLRRTSGPRLRRKRRRAFEAIVDYVLATFAEHPDMHVYHFGAYEPAAFKRLASRYATREAALDKILRAELFVDLHTIVRHSLRASVESYSIKELEQFYGLAREQDLRAATACRRAIEWAIEMHEDLGFASARTSRGGRALQPRGLRLGGKALRMAREAARGGGRWYSADAAPSSSPAKPARRSRRRRKRRSA